MEEKKKTGSEVIPMIEFLELTKEGKYSEVKEIPLQNSRVEVETNIDEECLIYNIS